MALQFPENVNECVYFTRRALVPKGKIVAWALRKQCPKCKKGLMAKPKKTSPTYDCPSCGYAEEKKAHEAGLAVSVQYVCPACGKSGETTTPYQRKSWNGVKAYVFSCLACGEKIGITKKLKEPKKKGAPVPDEDDDDE